MSGMPGERFSFTSLDFSPCRSSGLVRLPDRSKMPDVLRSNLCGKATDSAMLVKDLLC